MRSEVHRLPGPFLERLRRLFPRHKWDSFANTFTESRPTSFRINTLKCTDASQITEELQAQGLRFERVAWYRDAFVLKQGGLRELQSTSLYREGQIYVQSLSSMIPALVLAPREGEEILDLAAAPGRLCA